MNARDTVRIRMAVDILDYYEDAHLSAVRADLKELLERETAKKANGEQSGEAAEPKGAAAGGREIPDVEDWRFAHPAETAEETAAEAEAARRRIGEHEREAIEHDRELMRAKLAGHGFKRASEAVEYLIGEEGVPPENIAAVCAVPEFSVRAILSGKHAPVSARKIKLAFGM